MTSTTIHHKKNGTQYIYSVTSYWDKTKKAPRTKQTYIGKLNPTTGKITTSNRKNHTQKQTTQITAITKTHGPHLLLTKIANTTKLTDTLKQAFPNNHNQILSLAFFITQKGQPLSRCELWSQNHTHPTNHTITSQQISTLLKEITQNQQQHFLHLWLKHLTENEFLYYDITSISSYATNNEYVYWGYNRDHEKLPQINLAMLYGQKSGLPAYYRKLPGNISDVTTLKTTMTALKVLGQAKLQLVLDQGFYSEKNVDALFEKEYKFVLMVPTSRVWVRSIIDKYYESIVSPVNYCKTGEDEVLYMVSEVYSWNGQECFVHLYYNAARAAEDFDAFTKRLVECKMELESGNRQERNEEFYERFFTVGQVSEGGLSVVYNEEEIVRFCRRYAGFFCILSNVVGDSVGVLEVYRCREVVECCFDDLKNGLDMRRLRVHSVEAVGGRLFVQFLALILISHIRRVIKDCEGLRFLSAREVVEAMEAVVQITYSDGFGSMLSETGPLQRTIMKAFDLQ